MVSDSCEHGNVSLGSVKQKLLFIHCQRYPGFEFGVRLNRYLTSNTVLSLARNDVNVIVLWHTKPVGLRVSLRRATVVSTHSLRRSYCKSGLTLFHSLLN
jgi:hypothetical protein